MRPTDILKSEHRVIEQVLNCLERLTERAVTEGTIDRQAAEDAIGFFRAFADGCHHKKEEEHLFPAMEAKGFSRQYGPTGVMLYEHEQGRACVRGMDHSLAGAAQGDAAALRKFVTHARAYISLLREHIRKEDHCLFPMADNALDDHEQHSLIESFENLEHEEAGTGTHEKYLAVADALAEQFGVPRAMPLAGGPAMSCCGHHARG
jgi:hemerythrin-like domain-containing protein